MTARLETQPATTVRTTMKAIVREHYGSPDVLQLKEIARPAIDDDSALVRVRAASVNAYDWHMMRGAPLVARMGGGLRTPKTTAQGIDMAGVVEAVGKNVTHLRPGDEVYGARLGSFGEYVRAGVQSVLVPKPAGLTFEQAAAVPMAATTALQGLRDKGRLRPGQKVLIIGAGGGVGTFAVQIAKALGAHVTAVTSTENLDLVRSIGADDVIDYTREDFTRGGRRYDLIFDVAARRSLSDCRRALTSDGTLVMVGAAGSGRRIVPVLARILAASVSSRFGSQRLLPFMAHNSKEDLLVLKDLIEAGKVRPVIDRTYPLSQTADAVRYLEEGHARGKVVITMSGGRAA